MTGRRVLTGSRLKPSRKATTTGSYAALDSSSVTRTDTPLIAVPQSVETITHTLLVEQDVHTLADALVNVSGVIPTKSEEVLFTSPIIRGFPAEIYVDGLPLFGQTQAANGGEMDRYRSEARWAYGGLRKHSLR